MSYILDALRKSELQRRLKNKLVYKDAVPASTAANLLSGFTVVAGLVLALALGWGAWLLWGEPSNEVSAPPPETTRESTIIAPVPGAPASTPLAAGTTPPAVRPAADSPDLAKQLATPSRPATPAAVPAPVSASRRTPPGSDAPWLTDLSAEFRAQLPPLTVNIHVYAPDESQRILYINNHPYHQGEPIAGGVVVEEIVADGVVLRHQQQRFKLPRPQ